MVETMVPKEQLLEQRLDGLDKKVDDGFERVDERFKQLDEKVDKGFKQVDARFGRVETDIRELRGDIKSLDQKLTRKFDRLTWILIASLVGIVLNEHLF